MRLSPTSPTVEKAVSYEGMGEGVTFSTPRLERETEITGPSALKLFVSSSTADADIFAVLRVFDPKGKEVSFYGALDPRTPVGQGWLRASQRKLDPERSLPHRPFHAHDQKQPLKAGEVVELDVEIWPTCIVIPAGYRIALTIRGRDYEHDGEAASLSNMKNPMRRSEEHTSELQSPCNLGCRLLLEKNSASSRGVRIALYASTALTVWAGITRTARSIVPC